jgi:hypothetical protein
MEESIAVKLPGLPCSNCIKWVPAGNGVCDLVSRAWLTRIQKPHGVDPAYSRRWEHERVPTYVTALAVIPAKPPPKKLAATGIVL